MTLDTLDAAAVAAVVGSGQERAVTIVKATLARIQKHDPHLNCFTTVLADSALAAAASIDQQVAAGENPGPLAGVPYAVKNLFDIAGTTTLAGSKINANNAPATQDATAVASLKRAGAILIGSLNMDEYAYGFVTENSHYGSTHNPHDCSRIAGGSSGGSAAAVAAGLVPISLGSDTNGSIRVPAALCGVFGLKPTYGRLSRAGAALFSSSLDHIGPLARSVRDIATVFDLLQGSDSRDPVCTERSPEPCLPQIGQGTAELRIAIADDYFTQGAAPEALATVEQVAQKLGVHIRITLPETQRARAAAYLITASEGSNLHLTDLQTQPQAFDPATRDRFLAGALIPASWYLQAQRFRTWYRDQVRAIFEDIDIILAPATPCVAPHLGQATMMLEDKEVLTRPNLGLFTQPLSLIGLPVLSVPVYRLGLLPLGVQLVAAPYKEALILRVAAALEAQGIVAAPVTPHITD